MISLQEALAQLNERMGKYNNPHTGKSQSISKAAFHVQVRRFFVAKRRVNV
jgi:hypothetical protein